MLATYQSSPVVHQDLVSSLRNSPINIEVVSDPRIAAFARLHGAKASSFDPSGAGSKSFIAEGRFVLNRLIESDYEIDSILVEDRVAAEFVGRVTSETPIYAMPKDQITQLVGFDFHRGVMACGRRKPWRLASELISDRESSTELILGLIGLSDAENLGVILRSAAALGVNKILLGQKTVDPFSRRSIRVSMANVFAHDFFVADNLFEELVALSESGVQIIASALSDISVSLDEYCQDLTTGRRLLLVGNEANGLDAEAQEIADVCIQIPMHGGVDSLNAAVATSILLYELQKARNS